MSTLYKVRSFPVASYCCMFNVILLQETHRFSHLAVSAKCPRPETSSSASSLPCCELFTSETFVLPFPTGHPTNSNSDRNRGSEHSHVLPLHNHPQRTTPTGARVGRSHQRPPPPQSLPPGFPSRPSRLGSSARYLCANRTFRNKRGSHERSDSCTLHITPPPPLPRNICSVPPCHVLD